jgi:hypothetical protein
MPIPDGAETVRHAGIIRRNVVVDHGGCGRLLGLYQVVHAASALSTDD